MDTVYTFGPFRLDISSGILFRGANPVPVGRRAVGVLRTLVEHPGAPVSKDALMQAAWPGLAVEQRYERRDLAITTDFRNVFADLVSGHLGAKNVDSIFPGFKYPGQLGFLRT